MSRVVSTGDLGFDVVLGGGWRLVDKLNRKSTSILIRGGPGCGKSIMAFDVALDLARWLDGDVVVACVEVLPSEYRAQVESTRPEIVEQGRFIASPQQGATKARDREPLVFCGLLQDMDASTPDLVASLERLLAGVESRGNRPAAVIVDSLIAGYGLGGSAPRLSVDAVTKLAAMRGLGLVLCEENGEAVPSAWEFAADTVLALSTRPEQPGRWLEVRKHRFGHSATGSHEWEIPKGREPRVIPSIEAWQEGDTLHEVLAARGWPRADAARTPRPRLSWSEGLQPSPAIGGFDASLVYVVSWGERDARTAALGLRRVESGGGREVVIELLPTARSPGFTRNDAVVVEYLPTVGGAARALVGIVESLGGAEFRPDGVGGIKRIVMGDLACVGADVSWAAALRALCLVLEEYQVPVIVHDSSPPDASNPLRDTMVRLADLVIEFNPNRVGGQSWVARLTSRRDDCLAVLEWESLSASGLPDHLQRLPGPIG